MHGVDYQVEYIRQTVDCGYVEAFLQFCEDNNLDALDVIQEVSLPLKHKIEQDFINRKMVKGTRNDNSLTNFF